MAPALEQMADIASALSYEDAAQDDPSSGTDEQKLAETAAQQMSVLWNGGNGSPIVIALLAVVIRWHCDDNISALGNLSRGKLTQKTVSGHLPAIVTRPSRTMRSSMHRGLITYLSNLFATRGKPQPQNDRGQHPPPAPSGVLEVAAVTALLMSGTLQCYSRLLWAAHESLLPYQIRCSRDALVTDGRELLGQVVQLLRAMAQRTAEATRAQAPGAASGCAGPHSDRPAVYVSTTLPLDDSSRPVTASALPSLLHDQLVSSALLEHMAKLIVELLNQVQRDKSSPVGQDLDEDMVVVMAGLASTLDMLDFKAAASPTATPSPLLCGLVFGPCMHALLLGHTLTLCEAMEGCWADDGQRQGEDPTAASTASNGPRLRTGGGQALVRRLPLWDEQGQTVQRVLSKQAGAQHEGSAASSTALAPERPQSRPSSHQQSQQQPPEHQQPPQQPPQRPYLCVNLTRMWLRAARAELSCRAAAVAQATPPEADSAVGQAAPGSGPAPVSEIQSPAPASTAAEGWGRWTSTALRKRSILSDAGSKLQRMEAATSCLQSLATYAIHGIKCFAFERARLVEREGAPPFSLWLEKVHELAPGLFPTVEDEELAAAVARVQARGGKVAAQPPTPPPGSEPQLDPELLQALGFPEGGWRALVRQWWREVVAVEQAIGREAFAARATIRVLTSESKSSLVSSVLSSPLPPSVSASVSASCAASTSSASTPASVEVASWLQFNFRSKNTTSSSTRAHAAEAPSALCTDAHLEELYRIYITGMEQHTAIYLGSKLYGVSQGLEARKDQIFGLLVWKAISTPQQCAQAGRLLRNESALHLLCMRLARLGPAKWREAVAALVAEPETAQSQAATSHPPSVAGPPIRTPGDTQQAVSYTIRDGPLSQLVLQAMLLAREAIRSAWVQGGEAGGPGEPESAPGAGGGDCSEALPGSSGWAAAAAAAVVVHCLRGG